MISKEALVRPDAWLTKLHFLKRREEETMFRNQEHLVAENLFCLGSVSIKTGNALRIALCLALTIHRGKFILQQPEVHDRQSWGREINSS
jgi:hypothetical protein